MWPRRRPMSDRSVRAEWIDDETALLLLPPPPLLLLRCAGTGTGSGGAVTRAAGAAEETRRGDTKICTNGSASCGMRCLSPAPSGLDAGSRHGRKPLPLPSAALPRGFMVLRPGRPRRQARSSSAPPRVRRCSPVKATAGLTSLPPALTAEPRRRVAASGRKDFIFRDRDGVTADVAPTSRFNAAPPRTDGRAAGVALAERLKSRGCNAPPRKGVGVGCRGSRRFSVTTEVAMAAEARASRFRRYAERAAFVWASGLSPTARGASRCASISEGLDTKLRRFGSGVRVAAATCVACACVGGVGGSARWSALGDSHWTPAATGTAT